ncbi:MAG: hypothetical protein KTR29_06785 [Rhodothermaceae bacterium]|nr:hypothetical protein [Rhodothermaceae bacterium]
MTFIGFIFVLAAALCGYAASEKFKEFMGYDRKAHHEAQNARAKQPNPVYEEEARKHEKVSYMLWAVTLILLISGLLMIFS